MFVPIPEIMIGKYWRISGELQHRWNNIIDNVVPKKGFLDFLAKPNQYLAFWSIFWRYSDRIRKYHTPVHILESLREFDEVSHLTVHPFDLQLGLYGHDVIYDTSRKDNEEKSGKYMYKILTDLGAIGETPNRVRRLCKVTDHQTTPRNIDEMLICDLDLTSLGQTWEVFQRNGKNVRYEYRQYNDEEYRKGRIEILGSFLKRPSIYYTEHFKQKYEGKARANLGRAIRELR